MKLVLRWVIVAFSVWVAIKLVPGLAFDGTPWVLIAIAAALGLLNALVRPVMVLAGCPCVAVTFGLLVLAMNALLLGFAARLSGLLDLGLTSTGAWATFLGALVISVVSGVLTLVLVDD